MSAAARAFVRLPVPSSGTQAPGFDRYNDGARSVPMPGKWVTNAAKKEALAAAEAAFEIMPAREEFVSGDIVAAR